VQVRRAGIVDFADLQRGLRRGLSLRKNQVQSTRDLLGAALECFVDDAFVGEIRRNSDGAIPQLGEGDRDTRKEAIDRYSWFMPVPAPFYLEA
jgi:hypothetical protein